ncbi:VOC family protein [Streptomyces sp. LHD-70]|uniref:VOC family protein n=1 Tax=Streptomyces sp. LHD-70 TaxID=3072140 RepID=UPI0028102E59|nr:VOC family protein [Streptomyces sp. LHD-70]MDQ8701361.1 VOC family protein [Streptomyces sp. LHD-70]
MDYTLEVITLPVSDVDRAKEFYRDKVGFTVDFDGEVMPGVRVVQLTPPGSGCSVAISDNLEGLNVTPPPAPGSYQGMQLCVADIAQAHKELTGRGLDVTEPVTYGEQDGGTFMHFRDPDGNGWGIQEYRVRAEKPLRSVI